MAAFQMGIRLQNSCALINQMPIKLQESELSERDLKEMTKERFEVTAQPCDVANKLTQSS